MIRTEHTLLTEARIRRRLQAARQVEARLADLAAGSGDPDAEDRADAALAEVHGWESALAACLRRQAAARLARELWVG